MTAPRASAGRARHDRRPEPQPDEPDHGVGGRQLERHAARHPGPGECGVDLLAEPRLGPHLDERAGGGQLAEADDRPAGHGCSPGTTATSGSSARTGGPGRPGPGRRTGRRTPGPARRAHLLGHVPAAGVADDDLDRRVPAWNASQRALRPRARRCPVLPDHAEPQPPGDHARRSAASSARRQSTSASTRRARGSSTSPAAARRTERLVRSNSVTPLLPFEPGDLVAQRRLHDVAPRRGPGEAQLLGDRDEVLQLPQHPSEILD